MESLLSHQKQFLEIYASLSKNTDPMIFMKKIQSLIVSLKTSIIKETKGDVQKSHFMILSSLYKLIPYTRDIYGGMGERDFAYYMLFIWNYHFTVPTAKCLHKLILPIDNNPPFGSWRDIKSLCGVIRKYSEKGEDDPFIDTCISMMNHQLDIDYKKWNEAQDEYVRKLHSVYEIQKPTAVGVGISLVAKWVPREHSAYHWLFRRCALQWIRTFSPIYLTSCKTKKQFDMAFNKGSKEYRHVFTRLSKAWDILETKQCTNQWEKINMTNVPMIAGLKQQQALLNIGLSGKVRTNTMHSEIRKICADKYVLNRATNSAYKQHHLDKVNPFFIDMGYFIQQAFRAKVSEEMQRIENQWTHLLNQIPDMPHYLPILDCSMFYHSQKRFYEALGHACLLAMKSSKSIMLFDSTIQYISLQDCGTNILSILSTLKPIFHEHHIGHDFAAVTNTLVQSIEETNMPSENIADLKWVFFVDIAYSDVPTIVSIVQHSFTGKHVTVPRLLFWLSGREKSCLPTFEENNPCVSCDSSINVAQQTDTIHPLIVSGATNYVWTRISQIPEHVMKMIHPYDFVGFLLNQPRYNVFGDYFNTLLSREPTVP